MQQRNMNKDARHKLYIIKLDNREIEGSGLVKVYRIHNRKIFVH